MDVPIEIDLFPQKETVLVFCHNQVCKDVETDKLVLIYNPKDGFHEIVVAKKKLTDK